MKTYWWGEGKSKNWGDIFTPFLFARKYGIELELSYPSVAELFGVGSIVEHIPDGFKGHILGSGIQYAGTRKDLSGAQEPLLLRGELSAKRCTTKSVPVLGDPGILACLFVSKSEKKYERGIIPHYIDKQCGEVAAWAEMPETLIIDIESGVQEVIDAVASCKQIVSSSLHGLVLADSLGIPNYWVKLSDRVGGEGFKFYDYYSTYKEIYPPAGSIAEGFKLCRARETDEVKKAVIATLSSFASWVITQGGRAK